MNKNPRIVIPFVFIFLLITGGFVLGYIKYKKINNELMNSNQAFVKTQADLQSQITDLRNSIAGVDTKSESLSQALSAEQQKSTAIAQTVGSVSSTVNTLDKLSKSDPELLKKYSKVYFLNEHYVPISLTDITPAFLFNPKLTKQLHSNAWPFMQKLFAGISQDLPNSALKIDSAYRSFGAQAQLKSAYRFTYGAGTANAFSAEQGYSEHQLGTAVDFTNPKIGGDLWGFEKTTEYTWLTNNAYKYGYILSYPKDNSYYAFEPWHWRFVGVALATELHNRKMYFYDMDQREIDTYLAGMFDN